MAKAAVPLVLIIVGVLPLAHGQEGGDGSIAGGAWAVWSMVGSAASIRPGDLGRVVTAGPVLKFKSSRQGAARMSFATPPTAALNHPPPVALRLTVRYRDNGSKARVRLWGRALSIDTGAQETLAAIDSSDFPDETGLRTKSVWIENIMLPWDEYVFWIDVRLDKTGGTGKPELHAIMVEAF